MNARKDPSNEATMLAQTTKATPGTPAELPLHELTVRFDREHNWRCDPVTGALDMTEDRTALGYYLGLHRGRRVYRLADADGTPLDRLWAVPEARIVHDVPADCQPERVPASILRDREQFD